MRADSLGGRIVGAIARDPAVVSSAADPSREPSGRAEHGRARRGRSFRLRRNSMLGRIVAALARAETAFLAELFTQVAQEEPTPEAELTILVAGLQPTRKATGPTRVSVPAYPREQVEPTSEARLGIITVPA